jgi:hypothetical protein
MFAFDNKELAGLFDLGTQISPQGAKTFAQLTALQCINILPGKYNQVEARELLTV